jgi:hypothetical protein
MLIIWFSPEGNTPLQNDGSRTRNVTAMFLERAFTSIPIKPPPTITALL